MPTITYVNENIKIEVPEGSNVRYPSLENDIQMHKGLWKFANCHGNGLCATDVISVTPASNVNPLTFLEKVRLANELKKDPNVRLACQVRVSGDIVVKTRNNPR